MRAALAVLLAFAAAGCGAVEPAERDDAAPGLPPAKTIKVPNGFKAEIYARGFNHPTAMAFGPNGRLYVSQDVGSVVSVLPGATRPRVEVKSIRIPLGLLWIGDKLYISAQGRLERRTLSAGKLIAKKVLLSGLPYGEHQQNTVVLGPDGRLYIGSGSTCNACAEASKKSAAVLSVNPDGTGLKVVARGLRNPYGLAFRPGTDRLFATVNGRDDLPNVRSNEPAEMLVRVKEGAKYGWPKCWPSWLEKRMHGPCVGVTRPVAYLETHSSADGIAFATGANFPAKYKEGVFVALWGQYFPSPRGRRVVFVRLPSGKSSPFATGFAHPLALAFDAAGALLVADWERGTIYKISKKTG
jgi:glucose/arabinose dehydrogenase